MKRLMIPLLLMASASAGAAQMRHSMHHGYFYGLQADALDMAATPSTRRSEKVLSLVPVFTSVFSCLMACVTKVTFFKKGWVRTNSRGYAAS